MNIQQIQHNRNGDRMLSDYHSILAPQDNMTIIRSSAMLSAFRFQLLTVVQNTFEVGPKQTGACSSPRPLRVVVTGGGTGGHLFPGIAVARELMNRNSESNVLFVSTGNPFEKKALSNAGFELEKITVEGIKGRGLWNQACSVIKLPKGIIEATRILRRFNPDLILGLGSYSAGPVVMAARLLRKPIVLHEQNIVPGITNRILARFADRIYISFEDSQRHFRPEKIQWTGNPVRRDILNCLNGHRHRPHGISANSPFTILIIGGSQGAHSINAAVMEALPSIRQKAAFHFIHQTGPADEKEVKQTYDRLGVAATVRSFFDDMAPNYQAADLIICRAGATTVAEITSVGKAALFIPYPFAADDHQALNAATLVNHGAAEMILEKELNGTSLASKIEYFVMNPESLNDMATKAISFGRPDAAKNIVDDCYQLIGGNRSTAKVN